MLAMLLAAIMAQAPLQDGYIRSLPYTESHADELADVMSSLHGARLLSLNNGRAELRVRWDQTLLNVRAFKVERDGRESELALERWYDDRPTFASERHEGWFDIMPHANGYAAFLVLDGIWYETPDIQLEPEMMIAKSCSCGGTGQVAGCNDGSDCTNVQPCTLSNSVSTTCKWSNVRRQEGGGCFALDATTAGVGTGIFLPFLALSKRRTRRRARSMRP